MHFISFFLKILLNNNLKRKKFLGVVTIISTIFIESIYLLDRYYLFKIKWFIFEVTLI